MAEIIGSDHQYRLAVADLRMAGIQVTEAHRELLPRLLARGSIQMPIAEANHHRIPTDPDGKMDPAFSGGLYLQLDLIRAFLYRNSVTVAEVTQEARREKCRASAAAACQRFFNCRIQVDALTRAEAHNQSACQLATQAAAEAKTLFEAGRLDANRWQTWEQRRTEADLEQERLAARLRQARADANRYYCIIGVDESVLSQHTETFMQRLAGNAKDSSPPAADTLIDTLENTPGVVGAKLDLFLAEMNVIEARLKRLPSISIGVGAGQIPVQGDEWRKETGIVPMAEISMPILDMGDISRGVKRARLQAGQARERMIQAVETSRQTIDRKSVV
jgi:outer membrane protein TolC